MLGVKTYAPDYVASCRARIDAAVAAQPKGDASYFNNLVLLLDYLFVHRLRTVEGKDGNPMNEVRVLCDSLLLHGGAMTVEKAIKMSPEKTVLGYKPGDVIKLDAASFQKLASAYFEAIERVFMEAAA